MMILPAYEPPSDRRASVAVGLAPVFVDVVFLLIVAGLIAFDIGVAIFLASMAWVVWEMLDYQRALDAYNQQYVQGQATWRMVPTPDSTLLAHDFERQSDFAPV